MRTLAVLLILLPQPHYQTVFFHNPLFKEERIKIAIIDTGITINEKTKQFLCNGKHYDLTQTGIEDNIGHGTNIAGIVSKTINLKKNCLLIIKYYDEKNDTVISKSVKGFEIALNEKVKFVNYSSGGPGFSLNEKTAIKTLLDNQTFVSVAAGNNAAELSKKTCNYYPACYNFQSIHFKVVGNGTKEKPQQFSNYGEIVTNWRNGKSVEGFGIVMSGSSQSTAVLTSELIGKE